MPNGIADQDAAPIPLPLDVPWRRVCAAALDLTSPAGAPQDILGAEPGLHTLYPSLAVFYYPVPRLETMEHFPGQRLVLLRLVVSLTGMTPADLLDEVIAEATADQPSPPEIDELVEHAPCIGAIVHLSLSHRPPGMAPGESTVANLYVRDVYPKHQETVVNEVLGVETLERASQSVSTTKSWNVNTNASASIAGINVGASGGYSSTTAQQSEHERSKRNSRETQVQNIYHVLTGYHVGLAEATFTIQPRPYEGEDWQLLGGFRTVEGIQEFLTVVNVPYESAWLSVRASAVVGFQAAVTKGQAVGAEYTVPDRPALTDALGAPLPMWWTDGWKDYVTRLEHWHNGIEQLAKYALDDVVLATRFECTGEAKLFAGGSPCDDVPPPDPCEAGWGDVPTELEELRGSSSVRVTSPLFYERAIRKSVVSREMPAFQRRALSNVQLGKKFATLRRAATVQREQLTTLGESAFFQRALASWLHRLLGTESFTPAFQSFKEKLTTSDRDLLLRVFQAAATTAAAAGTQESGGETAEMLADLTNMAAADLYKKL